MTKDYTLSPTPTVASENGWTKRLIPPEVYYCTNAATDVLACLKLDAITKRQVSQCLGYTPQAISEIVEDAMVTILTLY